MSDEQHNDYHKHYIGAIAASNRLLAALCAHHPEECPQAVLEIKKRIKARGVLEIVAIEKTQAEKVAAWAARNKAEPRPVVPEMPLVETIRTVSVITIQQTVCDCYGISRIDLLSPRRTADIVRPRQIAMYLSKKLTLRSLPEIGRRFGGRDHTTVLHAVRTIGSRVERDHAFAAQVEAIREAIAEA